MFIDARKLGYVAERTDRDVSDEDISRVAHTYHAWRGDKNAGDYSDTSGFCKSAKLEEIQQHGHALTPGEVRRGRGPRR